MGLGSIVAVDTADKKSSFSIPDVLTAAALTTLANGLQAFCDADLRTRDFDDIEDVVGTPVHSGIESQVEAKAVLELYNTSNKKTTTMELPGPKDTLFLCVPGKGDRVLKASGDVIAAAIAAATGYSMTFVKGWPKVQWKGQK